MKLKRKLLTAILFVVASVSWANTLYAQEYTSNAGVTITQMYTEGNRPATPQFSYMYFFALSDMSWVPATCSASYIALPSTDRAMSATLLTAYITNKRIGLTIDNAQKSGSYCHATTIEFNNQF